MNVARAKAIVIVVAVVAALMGASASAQQPTRAPSGSTAGIPEVAPPSWRQEDWNAMRGRCLELSANLAARQRMTPEQLKSAGPLTSADLRDVQPCLAMIGQPAAPPPPPSLPGQSLPTPLPTTGVSPSAAPTAAITRFTISEKPPQFWAAEGGTQASWMAFRQRCADIGAELTRRQGMTYKQFEASPGLSFSRDEMLRCTHFLAGKAISGPVLSPSTSSDATPPTPMPTPLPPELPVGPQSLEPDTSDSPAAGQSFAGGSALVASVGAQSPSAAPTAGAPVGSIPEKIPPNWSANGWDQAGWTALREHCRAVFSQAAAAQNMTPEELKKLTPFPYSDWENCRMLSGAFSRAANAAPGSSPAPAPSGATPPTPMPTPR